MMNRTEITFRNPVKVLQVFRMVNEYGKDEKSFDQRKDKLLWKPISSVNGYVINGDLYLPAAIQRDAKFNNSGLITIEDAADITPQQEWKLINGRYASGNNHCFNLHHSNTYEFFSLGKDLEELGLKYNHSLVGDPSRDDFTIAAFEKNMAVEVKINGKHDTSRGRYFKEQYYIFEWLGTFNRCFILNDNDTAVVKRVPSQRKLVDLLKPLW